MSISDYASPRAPSLSDCDFYHSIDLPNGESHSGHWDLRGHFDEYVGHVPIAGRSFLDLGTATGFLSFEAERQGASRVVSLEAAVDTPLTPIPWAENEPLESVCCCGRTLERVKNSYWYCHRALGSRAEVVYRDIHALNDLGQFDVVIAGCVLLHLVDPIGALMATAHRASHTLIVTELDPYDFADQPVLLPNFARSRKRTPNDLMSWWQFPPAALSRLLDVMGFATARVERFTLHNPLVNQDGRFYALVAERLDTQCPINA